MIVANAISIGVEVEVISIGQFMWPITHLWRDSQADYGDDGDFWFGLEIFFLTVFLAELILNLIAFGTVYWEVS